MAKQRGLFKVEGSMDDVTFYKSRDGYKVRERGGVSASRMASDPAFARTRENQAEFSHAGKAGKVLRAAFRVLLMNTSDPQMVARLHKQMMRVVKSDTTSARGERNVLDGDLSLLKGFEFNANGQLTQTLFVPYSTAIDRASGELTIEIPSFTPENQLKAPQEATHYQIAGGGGFIDFENGEAGVQTELSAMLPLSAASSTALDITLNAGAGVVFPLFLALGISFYQEVNGRHYALKNGAFNSLALVEVEV